MATAYVELREGNYFLVGSRVSLDSIVDGFLNGESAETIRDNFPTLSLEQIHGSIAYYLADQTAINGYLKAKKDAYEEARRAQAHVSEDLRARIEQSRQQLARRT